jgi:hypothetical protein
MKHAADSNRAQWSEGVTVRAVLPLAPVCSVGGSGILVAKIPYRRMHGSCDAGGDRTATSTT